MDTIDITLSEAELSATEHALDVAIEQFQERDREDLVRRAARARESVHSAWRAHHSDILGESSQE